MLSKVINGYFQHFQEWIYPFNVKMDVLYTPNIEDYTQAMQNYNLRSMYDFDVLAALKLDKDKLKELSGKSYNVLQYKYNPLKRIEGHPNSQYYYIEIKPNGDVEALTFDRKYKELSREETLAIQAEYKEFQLLQSNPVMVRDIHQTLSGEVTPEIDEALKNQTLFRLAFYGEVNLECRFVTTSTQTFEDFLMLYNIFLCKRNPPAYINFGGYKYPITTKYDEIQTAQQVETNIKGNLLEISYSVTLQTIFMSSFVKKQAFVNRADIFFEAKKG